MGPGAGLGEQTRRLTLVLLATQRPCVLDANAALFLGARGARIHPRVVQQELENYARASWA
ncbi:hypothetical protein QWA_18322 [Alcaligenes faecalis subsp. faecalis NCIB 8687]|nr:hypothetical protein QWA_18322 [Alcaligenes faecalis subsp. faecalis NCIB 8687]